MMSEAVLAGVMDFVTRYTFLGSHLGQWAGLFGAVLLSFIVAKVISFLLLRQANRLARVEGWAALELVFRCMTRCCRWRRACTWRASS